MTRYLFILISLSLIAGAIWGGTTLMRGRGGAGMSEGTPSGGPVVNVAPIPAGTDTLAPATDPARKRYTHPHPAFSVEFPADARVQTYKEGGEGTTVLFEGPSGGFQVFVSPYGGDDTLDASDITRLYPFTVVKDPQTITINGTQAVLFWSSAEGVGNTREVWIAHSGWLFAVTARADRDAWLSELMTTWKFE